MSCFAVTLLACFKLSGIYVDAALIDSNATEPSIKMERVEARGLAYPLNAVGTIMLPGHIPLVEPIPVTVVYDSPTVIYNNRNPYARIAVGYAIDWTANWSTRLDYSHESSIATGRDYGAERFTLGITWRPFAH